MASCNQYIFENTGSTTQTITYSTAVCCKISCTYSLDISPGDTWSVNAYENSLTNISGLSLVSSASTITLYGFSSVCSNHSFVMSFPSTSSITLLCENEILRVCATNLLGSFFCFEEVLGCNELPILSGCYELITFSADDLLDPFPGECYHSFKLNGTRYGTSAACTADCPCGYPPSSCEGCDPTLSWSGFNEECCVTISDSISAQTPTSTTWTWAGITPQSVYSSSPADLLLPNYNIGSPSYGTTPAEYPPPLPSNFVWKNTTGTNGPLNRSGIWTTSQSISGPWEPRSVWLGFSVCLSVPSSKTYYFGIGYDNFARVKVDNNIILSNTNDFNIKYFNKWRVYPIYLQQGSHIFNFEVMNHGLLSNVNIAVIGWELYNASRSQLINAAQISDLQILYSSSAYTGQQIQYVLDANDTFNNSGNTCPVGYTYSECDGMCYLYELCCPEPPPPLSCEFSGYCINGTETIFDDYYVSAGTDTTGLSYYTGQTNNLYIYFNRDRNQWCLSDSLGGNCYLFGRTNCITECPDFCDEFFSQGSCTSTTTTTTINCSTFDFTALFDCEVFPTTTTTTSTSTTTTTTIPPPDPCSATSVNATLNFYTTTTTTSTSTTTTTTIYYPCNFSGDVTFNVIDVEIKCPISKEFKDCFDMGGTRYYTNDILTNPLGGDIEVDMVFSALVDGELKCVSYVGINNDVSPINTITLVDGSFGTYPEGCSVCNASTTTTTTIAPTTTTTTTTTIPCYCYALVSSKFNTFTYTDCNGNAQTQSVVGDDGVIYVCSRTQPISDAPTGTATLSESCPISSNNCTLPPCYCYTIVNNSGRYGVFNQFVIVDCDGVHQFVSIAYGATVNVCSRVNPTPTDASGFAATLQATNCNNCGVI